MNDPINVDTRYLASLGRTLQLLDRLSSPQHAGHQWMVHDSVVVEVTPAELDELEQQLRALYEQEREAGSTNLPLLPEIPYPDWG